MLRRILVLLLLFIGVVGISPSTISAGSCYIDQLSVSPSSPVTVGTTVTFHRKAHCDGQLRAIRQTFNGNPWGEYGGPENDAT